MTWWLTADTHFNHTNIIKYCYRPFATVEEMNEALIENWNKVVRPGDNVIHCGDFAMAAKPEEIDKLIGKLHGNIHLIVGNHDKQVHKAKRFASQRLYHRFKIGDYRIFACHYAMKVWDRSHHGTAHAYGHSHNTLPVDQNSLSMDVGVDANKYTPISVEEFASVMATRTYVPLDHHDGE